jgi:hypothetical protein
MFIIKRAIRVERSENIVYDSFGLNVQLLANKNCQI